MKKLLICFALVAAAVAASIQQASAQIVDCTPTPVVVYNSVATNLPVGTLSIDCTAQQNIGVQWTFCLNGAGTEVHGIRFVGIVQPGVRPSTPTLADGFVMSTTANGTTPVIVSTNFNVKGFVRLDGYYITNGTAGLATNWLCYSVKRNAP